MRPRPRRRVAAGAIGKGDVLGVARLAGHPGRQAHRRLIPLCHPLRLTGVDVELARRRQMRSRSRATVRAFDRTGVEMEALTAVSAAALTVYDMCKAIDRGMVIADDPPRREARRQVRDLEARAVTAGVSVAVTADGGGKRWR